LTDKKTGVQETAIVCSQLQYNLQKIIQSIQLFFCMLK